MNRVLFTHLTLTRSGRVCEPHSLRLTHISRSVASITLLLHKMDGMGWIIRQRVLLGAGSFEGIRRLGEAHINGIN